MTRPTFASTRCRRGGVIAACLALAGLAAPANAQLHLPSGGLPALPGQLGQLPPLRSAEPLLSNVPLQELRLRTVRDLLRNHADVLEAGPAGEPMVRSELVVVSPTPGMLDAARAQGFRVLREQALDGIDVRSVVVAPPRGMTTDEGRARLRALDPQIEVDFNHVYTSGGDVTDAAASAGNAPTGTAPGARRVGLVDSGVDVLHPALRRADVKPWGCDGKRLANAHGTSVASLLVGRDGAFAGVVPAATLFAADVYCDRATGGSAEAVAQALAWMARERVGVVNISLVGPANRLLERAVRALASRGHLIVAAVGNDGPAAPALYPAAYAEVIGVTGVSTTKRVLPEAAQGPQVAFAALGAEIAVARAGTRGYAAARGTSFASPMVAGLLSEALHEPDLAAAEHTVRALANAATDLGAPGRDSVYGWGFVDAQSRIAPARVQAAARTVP